MTRIALPSGRLLPSLIDELGLTFVDPDARDYTYNRGGVQYKVLHPRTIPKLVTMGRFDRGYTGLDLVRESTYENRLDVSDRLGLKEVQIVVASTDSPTNTPEIIATEYVNIARRWAFDNVGNFIVVHSHGHTEALVPEDADRVIECVETGRTLEANGLEIDEVLFKSETVEITPEEI